MDISENILAKNFPITWENFGGLSWQYHDLKDFLKSWLVDEWELISAEEFDGLSMLELLAMNETAASNE